VAVLNLKFDKTKFTVFGEHIYTCVYNNIERSRLLYRYSFNGRGSTMLVVYDSLMGKTERFVRKTGLPCIKITEGLIIDEPYVLVTYTCGHGEVPKTTLDFLANNHEYMIGVSASGHRNWGAEKYARAGVRIAETYNVPLINRFQMSGMPSDIENFIGGANELYEHNCAN
jgi:protein involved in ribonucleotide reduction